MRLIDPGLPKRNPGLELANAFSVNASFVAFGRAFEGWAGISQRFQR